MFNTGNKDSLKQFDIYSNSVKTLAVVGFLFLVAAGILLAIYMAHFVPATLQRVDTATATLSQVFTPVKHSSLAVVQPPTTLPFSVSTSTIATTTQRAVINKQAAPTVKKTHKKIIRTHARAGKETHSTYIIHGKNTSSLYGFPDFTVHIIAVGYLTSTSTNSFIATTTIPHGTHIYVKFSIKNIGTNKTGSWKFRATIPTSLDYIFNSPTQKSLNPGDYVKYMLGFDQAKSGSNQTISITANATGSVAESNNNNDSASVALTILGN